MKIRDITAAEKVQRFDWIQGAIIDFSNGRPIDDVWQEVVGIALPAERDDNNDPESCPEWLCPELSTEDRRDGNTCPDHPCTCAPGDLGSSQ